MHAKNCQSVTKAIVCVYLDLTESANVNQVSESPILKHLILAPLEHCYRSLPK